MNYIMDIFAASLLGLVSIVFAKELQKRYSLVLKNNISRYECVLNAFSVAFE